MVFFELMENVSWLSMVFFFVGIAMIVVEAYNAGFGLFGLLGILSFVGCIIVSAKTVTQAIVLTIFFFIIVFLIFLMFLKLLSKGRIAKKLTLSESTSKELGYSGTVDMSHLVGSRGVVETTCRPAGTAVIFGERIDVVSDGEFIEKGTHVEVIEVEGYRIVVKAIQDAQDA